MIGWALKLFGVFIVGTFGAFMWQTLVDTFLEGAKANFESFAVFLFAAWVLLAMVGISAFMILAC